MIDGGTAAADAPAADSHAAEALFRPVAAMGALAVHGFTVLPPLPGIALTAWLPQALGSFAAVHGQSGGRRLFCRLDPLSHADDTLPARLAALMAQHGMAPGDLVLELASTEQTLSPALVHSLTERGLRVALADFGRGQSGLECLVDARPDYLKLGPRFTAGIANNTRAQAVMAKLIGLGHALGVPAIATQVVAEADFRLLRELGCNMAEGDLIGTATSVPSAGGIPELAKRLGRGSAIPPRIADLMMIVQPLTASDTLTDVVTRFRQGVPLGMLPVVDDAGQVLGAVFERDLRTYLFSDFGAALIENRGLRRNVVELIRPCPVAEATAAIEAIVESYMIAPDARGLVLTLDGRLAGMMSSHNVLQLTSERAVADAQDRNPLTALPGNASIRRYLSRSGVGHPHTVIFFDFDNFKAFNDAYGFAEGDRVILHFADVLQAAGREHGGFVSHVGGDDFFACFPLEEHAADLVTRRLLDTFRRRAEAHYSPEHRAAGGFRGKDRYGEQRFFPLIRAAAVLLHLPADRQELEPDEIVAALARGKSAAKASVEGLHRISLDALLASRDTRAGEWPTTSRHGPRSSFLAEAPVVAFPPAPALAQARR
ncbi:bifunctional diguanylate cyclase/phosphodiesterase [Croceibacterium ferulae]|uniref:bifunctional diguanylate cyclase/phosphodiesterase n=1 Tax=Croceibacterium ferulae TaxID=1854641 RepID=UPI00138FF896|nr:bifunctional diguanylate cyclase/phosphodiesterase [Croceibacterium ferulae]